MKVVDVCAFYAPAGGGVRTYVDQKLLSGPALGHEIVIIAPGPSDRTEVRGNGARIEWIASPRFPLDRRYRSFGDCDAVYRKLDSERPDVVEASSPWRSAGMVAQWPGDAARVLIMHADPVAAYAYRWFEGFASPATVDRQLRWFWSRLSGLTTAFDAVISAGVNLSARLTQNGLGKVTTNPMGVTVPLFSPAFRDEGLRARLLERCALPANALLLLGVGRHAPEKRWPMVVEAVMSAGFRRPVGLVLIGDGRERARIVRQINGDPHIHLLSPISDRSQLARIMASADALIHGCDAETFSMVAAEAVASGLPLIVPDRGGAADHANASGGATYVAGSAADAARAIAEFKRPPDSLRRTRVRAMDEHFSDLFAFYRTLEASHRRPTGAASLRPQRL
ncbi:MAG: glycosyltransferase [Alphaproteobacteria bacterium]|nr:glycosyltransferase [Alphaproteobacteria bacterium]